MTILTGQRARLRGDLERALERMQEAADRQVCWTRYAADGGRCEH